MTTQEFMKLLGILLDRQAGCPRVCSTPEPHEDCMGLPMEKQCSACLLRRARVAMQNVHVEQTIKFGY
jgi:hypothetical protein